MMFLRGPLSIGRLSHSMSPVKFPSLNLFSHFPLKELITHIMRFKCKDVTNGDQYSPRVTVNQDLSIETWRK